MTLRQTAWFLIAYLAVIALSVWFNVSVLCSGDLKYDQGCGGLGVYIPLWEIFLAPLAVAAVALERWRRTSPPPAGRLLLYIAGIAAFYQIGWRLERFPVLLLLEAAVIVVAALARWRVVQHRPSQLN